MISVAIVDAQRDSREGVQRLIDSAGGYTCIGAFADGHSALDAILQWPPTVVLVEAELPDMRGSEFVRRLFKGKVDTEVLVYSDKLEDEDIFQGFKAGAVGFLSKKVFPSGLLHAIHEACTGGAPMSPEVARRVVTSFRLNSKQLPMLSEREYDVLALLCKGFSSRKIGERLFVSSNTVRFHLKNIYRKLKVSSRHEAVIMAAKEGML
ncbi:MAG: response regulator transcription factor [Phaeodactylibacter sp.]|nr:response regulator transcription factor [Phaeodactylibacter sp.]MCB9276759.1 response regulator transcription factor [Lewinellaceae bacterium]